MPPKRKFNSTTNNGLRAFIKHQPPSASLNTELMMARLATVSRNGRAMVRNRGAVNNDIKVQAIRKLVTGNSSEVKRVIKVLEDVEKRTKAPLYLSV